MTVRFAITLLTKDDGPLTKLFGLNPDGSLHNDSHNCLMTSGTGQRQWLSISECGALLPILTLNQAIALGGLRSDLPNSVSARKKHSMN